VKSLKCFEILKECNVQCKALEVLSKSIQSTLSNGKEQIKEFGEKLKETRNQNNKIMKSFEEDIEKLKKIELHPCLKLEKHKTLMDVYYTESHMRDWSKACKRSEEKLFDKVNEVEQGIIKIQQQVTKTKLSPSIKPVTDLNESKELVSHLENFINEKEPLILSMLATLCDDLKNFREALDTEGVSNITKDRIEMFVDKEKSHKELVELMKEHQKELDGLLKALIKTKISNAKSIGSLLKEIDPLLTQLNNLLGEELKKGLKESLKKIKADFEFLLNPGLFPEAYKESLKEIIRRSKVNELLENEGRKLMRIIEKEQVQRQTFIDKLGKLLPNNFFSHLKNVEVSISIKINPVKDIEKIKDQELERGIDISSLQNELSSVGYGKEVEELQKELEQQKTEHISIQTSLRSKISELEFIIQIKNSDEQKALKTIKEREGRINQMEQEQEKLHKMIQDMTQGFKEHLARKQVEIEKKDKELHNLLIDLQNYTLRKKNCAFCGELVEFKGGKDEYLAEINQKLNEKSAEIKILEDKLEKSSKMLNAASNSLFNLMSNKVNDKELKMHVLKEEYERRLMETEEYLVSEQDKCALFKKQKEEELEKEINNERQKLKEKKVKLTNKLQQMESKVNYFEKENKKLTLGHQSSVATEKALKAEIEQLKKDARIRKEVVVQKESVIKQLTDQKQALLKDCTEAKLALDKKVKEVEKEAELKIASMEAKLNEKCRELFEAESKISERQKEKGNQVEKNLERIKVLEIKMQAKEVELDKLKAKEAGTQSQLLSKDQDLLEVRKSLEEKQRKIDKLNECNKELNKKLTDMNNEVKEKIQANAKDKENCLSEEQGNIKDMTELIEKYKSELEFAHETEAKNNEAISLLKTKLEKVQEEIAAKDKIIEVNIKDLSITKSRLESFEKQIEENQKFKNLWEESTRNKFSSGGIHYSILEKGGKMLFMPHSPGIYVALLLTEPSGDESKTQTTGNKSGVVKKKLASYVFLDLHSLPDKLQKILMNFSMLVIGIVKDTVQLKATEDNSYKLPKGQVFYQCTLQSLENIVGFETDEPLLTNYEFMQS